MGALIGKNRLLAPDPTEGVGEEDSAVFPIVAAFSGNEFVVVIAKLQGFVHLQVSEPPIPVFIVEVLVTVLKVNPDVPLFSFANKSRVNVSPPDVGEAANVADDVFEKVGSFPGDGEGADSSGAHPADRPAGGIVGEFEFFPDFGEDFLFEEFGVFGAQGIVFDTAVTPFFVLPALLALDLIGEQAGVQENADGERDFALGVEIVEGDGRANEAFVIDVGVAVLEDEDVGLLCSVVLGGNVKVVLAQGSLEDIALPVVTGDGSFRDAFLGFGIGGEFIVLGMNRGHEQE